MTLGCYPPVVRNVSSSFGIEEMMNGMNQAMIDVRGVKQAIWKREMDHGQIFVSNMLQSMMKAPNYWKNSIGTNKAIRKLKVLEKKRELKRPSPSMDSEYSCRTGETDAFVIFPGTEL